LTAATTPPHVLMPGPYPEWDMAPMAASYTLLRWWEAADRQAFIAEHAQSIRAIATRGELGASTELIASLPNLELVACYGVGTDAIDLAACRARGIRVTNTPDVLNGDVADLAVGLTLALQRSIPAGDRFVRSGEWAKGPMPLSTRVFGQRVGIAGFGRIGSTIARRLSGFEMELGYFSRTAREDTMFSVEPITPTSRSGRPSSAIAPIPSSTAAPPHMSNFISCIRAAGLIE